MKRRAQNGKIELTQSARDGLRRRRRQECERVFLGPNGDIVERVRAETLRRKLGFAVLGGGHDGSELHGRRTIEIVVVDSAVIELRAVDGLTV